MSDYVDSHQIKMSDLGAVQWVATLAALQTAHATLTAAPQVAVDTESDSLYSYFEKVCLLQFSTPATDLVVDPLAFADTQAIATLAPLFAAPHIEKVFHAAEYDILCLKRDYQFEFVAIFDTMIAARILGWKNVGLGAILQEHFGVTLNKKMQRADWGHRPLTAEHIAYAREDTHYLLRLRDLQLAELERTQRLAEAREEFERLTRVTPTPRRFDPDAYWNLNGARDLDAAQLGALRELFRWRDAQARKQDRPPFKILSDAVLVHLADAKPATLRALAQVHGVSEFILQRYGRALVENVARGLSAPQTETPRPHMRGEPLLDNVARNRLATLKAWRKQRAELRGVEPDVIVSNDVLFAIARKNPRTLDALREAANLGAWKTREYSEELFDALHGKPRG